MPIEPLEDGEMLYPIVVGRKLNELIEAFNEFRTQMYPLEATINKDLTITWGVSMDYRKEHSAG